MNPYAELEQRYGLPPGILMAVRHVESGGNSSAVSPKGAGGAFQIMPATAEELGVDPFDEEQAADGAARYLSQNLQQFGDINLALAAYNAGPGNVQKYGGIPPFKETQDYVNRVNGQLSGGTGNDTITGGGEWESEDESTSPITASKNSDEWVFEDEPQLQTPQKSLIAQKDNKEAKKPGFIDNLGQGFVRGMKQRALGVAQTAIDAQKLAKENPRLAALNPISGLAAMLPSPSDDIQGEMQTLAKQYNQEGVGTGAGGFIGEVLGDPLTYAPVPGAAGKGAWETGKALVKGAALSGGASALTTAEETNKSLIDRGVDAAQGAAMAIPLAVGGDLLLKGGAKAASVASKPLQSLASGLSVSPDKARNITQAGLSPNLAAVSENPMVKRLYNALGELPGGSKRIAKSNKEAGEAINQTLSQLGYTGNKTPTDAGIAIRSGLERFQEKGKARYAKLEKAFDKMVGGKDVINLDPAKLGEKFDKIVNAPGIIPEQAADRANHPAMQEVQKILRFAAENGGDVTYGSLKEARSKIGAMIEDDKTGIAKQVYGAMTQSMKDFAKEKGGAKALKAFEMRDRLYSDFMDERKAVVDKLLKKVNPEDLYKSMVSGTKIGGTTPDKIMNELDPMERDVVRDAVIREIGGGENFSVINYFNRYSKLSPEAKAAFFKGRTNLKTAHDRLAKAVENFSDIKNFGNPSGSGFMIALTRLIQGGSAIAALSGATATAGGVAGGLGLTRVLAEGMTNPRFVNALADAAEKAKIGKKPSQKVIDAIGEFIVNPEGLSIPAKVGAIQLGEQAAQ